MDWPACGTGCLRMRGRREHGVARHVVSRERWHRPGAVPWGPTRHRGLVAAPGGERSGAQRGVAVSWPLMGFLAALVLVNVAFFIGWARARHTHPHRDAPTIGDVAIGFGTDFF